MADLLFNLFNGYFSDFFAFSTLFGVTVGGKGMICIPLLAKGSPIRHTRSEEAYY